MLAALIVVAAGCGGGAAQPEVSSSTGAQVARQEPPGSCGALAVEYAAAFAMAARCEPAEPSACGAQRPVAVFEQRSDGTLGAGGLCVVAHSGYLPASHTDPLDEILARYQAAGCKVGFCPGPSPHTPQCLAESDGVATCG